MESRSVGKSEVVLPPIVYGAWAIGGWWWGGTDDPNAISAMRAAAHEGMMAIDTAPIYGFGHSESLVGEALQSHRSSVFLLTKCGLSWTREDGPAAFPTQTPSGKKVLVRNDLRPASIRRECEDSLKRLRTDVIDLYQCHWPDPETPIEDTMEALARLREEGKIRAIGVSNFDVELLEKTRRCLGDVPLASTQPRYSLLARQVEASVLPWCRTHGIGVLAYRPIEQGLLAGAVPPDRTFPPGDMRPTQKIFSSESRQKILDTLDGLRDLSTKHDATMAQLALAWVISQPGLTAAIAGARSAQQALENQRAAALSLSQDELDRIGRAFDPICKR